MANEIKLSIKNVIEYVVKIGLIAFFIFLWNINKKVNDISDNKASIQKLWQKYGELDNRADVMNHDIGTLKGRHIE